jgi:hypothetical protein
MLLLTVDPSLPLQTTDRVWKPLPQLTEQPPHGEAR